MLPADLVLGLAVDGVDRVWVVHQLGPLLALVDLLQLVLHLALVLQGQLPALVVVAVLHLEGLLAGGAGVAELPEETAEQTVLGLYVFEDELVGGVEVGVSWVVRAVERDAADDLLVI